MSNPPPEVLASSAGTAIIQFTVPDNPSGVNLWNGNYIIAKVNGRKQVLTSAQVSQLLKDGQEVEAVSP